MKSNFGSGWYGESYRHYLSAKGVKTGKQYYSVFGKLLGERLEGAYDRARAAKVAAATQQRQAAWRMGAIRAAELEGRPIPLAEGEVKYDRPGLKGFQGLTEQQVAEQLAGITLEKRATIPQYEYLLGEKEFAQAFVRGGDWIALREDFDRTLMDDVFSEPTLAARNPQRERELLRRIDLTRADMQRLTAQIPPGVSPESVAAEELASEGYVDPGAGSPFKQVYDNKKRNRILKISASKRVLADAMRREKVYVRLYNDLVNRDPAKKIRPYYPIVANNYGIMYNPKDVDITGQYEDNKANAVDAEYRSLV